ncbi:BTB/POZ domain-containing protein 17-like [Mizuhopecten yessoensis]|uniref:BTB/POZ domain-containing protein 17-like n=1 Tax=Mizuhopecten yessoensis TaxID=6573 RepID=UPI000B45CC95|nr:BTB/POZ domain-containing protein 17-like [Mizuhopecten yessoensis]XP_021341859.1 BTB/POZ domain-containing protein 17-like [Mizuhopecten yessoensis]XP_021341860.1 BTB/POZ domain-containing protein 17-like [Mizuhopecten yessoensis]XP_021341861.1 BTB/POZ domain-containing protein 17-like [Mizuhopecten yessoensis]XP_021341862.1 BTB/POZ domain-containing protein 17-like [Mizuhopecten yessoensis]XP_021341863.1 BTB/POZ domain-containing protein 17-like [Mizuhopecten yessoensis]
MKRFSPSGQHYPDPSKPPENGTEEISADNINDGSKKVKTSQSFESLFDNETLSDVVLNVNDGQFVFNGHKMILGMKSDTLAALLNEISGLDSDEKPVLCLHESIECSLVFSRFLYFIYSGAVWLHRDYVLPLHKLAAKYSVKSLVHHCQSYVTQILHNMMGVYENIRGFQVEVVCDLYECNLFPEDIRSLSFKVLCAKFKELVQSDRWQACSWQLVCDLIRSDDCMAEENLILTSATDWMKKNNLSDKTLIEDILVNIRYPFLHRRILYQLKKNGAFRNFPQVQVLVNNAVHYHCFKDLSEAKDEFTGLQYTPRHYQTRSFTPSVLSSRAQSTDQIANLHHLHSNMMAGTVPSSNLSHSNMEQNILNHSVLVQSLNQPVSFVQNLTPSQLVQSVRPNVIRNTEPVTVSMIPGVIPSSVILNGNPMSQGNGDSRTSTAASAHQPVTPTMPPAMNLVQNIVSNSTFGNPGSKTGEVHHVGYR